jgi:spore coat protein U-like protein
MRTSKMLLTAAAVAAVVFLSGPAAATTLTDTFHVNIEIEDSCALSADTAADIDFGPHSHIATFVQASGQVLVNCTDGVPFDLGLDGGQHSSGLNANQPAEGDRHMAHLGVDLIQYDLYQDASRHVFWGNLIGTDTLQGVGTGVTQAYDVYGQVPSTNVPAGIYSDVVTVSLTF